MELNPNRSRGEHFNLRWNSYTNNLMQELLEHQQRADLVDVTLCCEGQFIRAHKLVLSACSQVFQDMFKVHHTVQHPMIFLNRIKCSYFKYILDFMYQGEVIVPDVDLEGVLTLGKDLQVKGLSSLKLRHQVSSEELETTAVKQNKQFTETISHLVPKTRSLSNSPVIIHKPLNPSANTESIQNDYLADRTSSQTQDDRVIGLKRLQPDENTHIGVKRTNTNSDANRSIKNIPIATSDVREKKHFKSEQTDSEATSSALNSSNGHAESRIGKNITEAEKNPRPLNAFMIFANEWRKKLTVEHPEENNKSISVRLGNIWKSLSNETKESYYQAVRKMEMQQKGNTSEQKYRADQTRKRKVARRKTIDSVSHLVSVDLQEYDDDDLQIIEINENPIDISSIPEKGNMITKI